ncbi:sensor histidine kinase [Geodermatophilus nigrescens]|uniref:histidine kinase n=1 Tax=Geodermatophilus nigrescens TaxID=1070870 RepID=A0A1M5FV68_9ACTN|nr:histidine kinase [Geodermatophilus nigrescens]SHF95383.1 Signal transduction histidine kinase [Geodermatophilus nigrescens]
MEHPSLPRPADAALPGALAVLTTVETLAVRPAGAVPALALELVACLALCSRRRWTVPACSVAGGVLLVPLAGPEVSDLTGPLLVLFLAAFSLGRHLRDLRGLPLVLLYLGVLLGMVVGTGDPVSAVGDVVWVGVLVLSPYAAGVLVRVWADRIRTVAAEAARAAAEQERVRQEAVTTERARIARELHDVLAHSVSAMVLQAAAAEDLVRTAPERAAQVLGDVAVTGRRALAETSRLLHRVRDPGDDAPLGPDAGLARVGELVERAERTGMRVDLSLPASVDGLPAALDLSAYRVVQEALTNALRHGSGEEASVAVTLGPTTLEIHVANPLGPAGTAGSGLGLVGVGERVAVLGGRMHHGPTADGRYLLDVSLPLPGRCP